MSYSRNTFRLLGKYSSRNLLLSKYGLTHRNANKRYLGIVPVLGRIFKLRYLFFGTAVGGGVAVHNVIIFFQNKTYFSIILIIFQIL